MNEERRQLDRDMLARIDERTEITQKDVSVLKESNLKMHTRMAVIETKAGIFGVAGGFLSVALWGIKDLIGKG